MSKQTVTAEVEIDFKDGKRTIEMVIKEQYEIEDWEEGKTISGKYNCPITNLRVLNNS